MANDPTPTDKPATEETTRELAKNVPVRTALKAGADDNSWQQYLNRYTNRDDAP